VIRLNGDAVRDHRLDLGLSARDLSTATGISTPTLRAIEENADVSRTLMNVLMLQRLIDTLGVRLGDLLADDTPTARSAEKAHAPESRPDDVATLSDLLLHARTKTSKRELAAALGWTTDRLMLAVATLDRDLRPLGLQVHAINGTYLLRPLGATRERNGSPSGATPPRSA